MNTRRTHANNDSNRETLQALIDQALSDLQHPEEFSDVQTGNNSAPSGQSKDAFFAAVQSPWLNQPTTLSLIEQWASNASRLNWYEQAKSLVDSLRQQANESIQAELNQLTDSLSSLSGRLVSAPAHRGASTERMVYPSQRRNIPAADLPTFHALFCTAVNPGEGPVRLAGLSMDSVYRCRFESTSDSTWRKEPQLKQSASGGFSFDLRSVLADAPDRSGVVWVIEEEPSTDAQPAWISGVIWKFEANENSFHNEIDAAADTLDWPWNRIKTLIEINRLFANQMYVEAYETARCAIRAERAAPNDGSVVPFAEALWLMIEKCLDAMIEKLEAAQPVFQFMKPEWDALQPLRRLRQDISLST